MREKIGERVCRWKGRFFQGTVVPGLLPSLPKGDIEWIARGFPRSARNFKVRNFSSVVSF